MFLGCMWCEKNIYKKSVQKIIDCEIVCYNKIVARRYGCYIPLIGNNLLNIHSWCADKCETELGTLHTNAPQNKTKRYAKGNKIKCRERKRMKQS